MLFRKKMPRSCSYCVHGAVLDEDDALCAKRGVVPLNKACRKFRYDPAKRIPPRTKTPDFEKYKKEDFIL